MDKEDRDNEYTKRITFRLTEREYKRLLKLLVKTRHSSLSSLIRTMLFRGNVKIVTRDDSLDAVMEQLSTIRSDLHRMGININQITRRFHTEKQPEKRLFQALEVQHVYKETGDKVDRLLKVITEISYKWLPGS